jgi:hypothetical protein
MRVKQIVLAALEAIDCFLDKEHSLLKADANERSLTHKLAEYLQKVFPELHVDCEYNRLGAKVKRLPQAQRSRTDDTEGRTIFPDIIVHRRGKKKNLLAIEVKKSTNRQRGDDEKLCGLTAPDGEYTYRLGLHLVIDCKKCTIARATAFTKGSADKRITAILNCILKLEAGGGCSACARATL